MIDEAFLPFSEIISKLTSFNGVFESDEEGGVRSYIYEFDIEMPVEMDVVSGDDGVQIGTIPPLYDVNTTFKPSLHTIRFTAVLSDENET